MGYRDRIRRRKESRTEGCPVVGFTAEDLVEGGELHAQRHDQVQFVVGNSDLVVQLHVLV